MPHRPSISRIRSALLEQISRDRLSIHDIAGAVHSSRSALQRVLMEAGTTYSKELRRARVQRAIELLVVDGHSAHRTAQEVGVSRDHLCVILKQETGLTARQLQRAAELDRRIRRWRKRGPAPAGTKLYDRQRYEWAQTDTELRGLLEDLPHDHPLADWAKAALLAANRPDFRQRPYREELQQRRSAERAAWNARLQRAFTLAAEYAEQVREDRHAA